MNPLGHLNIFSASLGEIQKSVIKIEFYTFLSMPKKKFHYPSDFLDPLTKLDDFLIYPLLSSAIVVS